MNYNLTEEEMFDTIPVNSPIEVISADSVPATKLKFTIKEYDGAEVYKLDQFGRAIEQPLENYEDLSSGMDIAVPNFHGSYWLMKVQEDLQTATANSSVAHLQFAEDERKCWVCIAVVNRTGKK